MSEFETDQNQIRTIDCMQQLELGENMPFLELITPLIAGNQLNKRYRWFLDKFSGISVAHDIGLKTVEWTITNGNNWLPFIQEIGVIVGYHEADTTNGERVASAEFMMPDYFLYDYGEDQPEGVSLLDMAGYYLFEDGIIIGEEKSSRDKDTALVLRRVLPSGYRISALKLKERLYNDKATCLEFSIIAGLAASLYPFLRTSGPFANNPIVDLQVIGAPGKNKLLGSEQDPLHYGVVILDSNDERWVMLAGREAYSEIEIIEAFKETKRLRRDGLTDEYLHHDLRAQALALKMIKKSRLTM